MRILEEKHIEQTFAPNAVAQGFLPVPIPCHPSEFTLLAGGPLPPMGTAAATLTHPHKSSHTKPETAGTVPDRISFKLSRFQAKARPTGL